jgi:hypothetical protein
MDDFGIGFSIGYAFGMFTTLLILIMLIIVKARLDYDQTKSSGAILPQEGQEASDE